MKQQYHFHFLKVQTEVVKFMPKSGEIHVENGTFHTPSYLPCRRNFIHSRWIFV